MAMAHGIRFDWRRMPRLMACGPGSAAAFESYGFAPELTPPMEYSAEGLAAVLRECDLTGQSVLRLRSEKAGPLLAEVLREQGAQVDDVQLYTNEPIIYPQLPACEAVFFASASAVEAFVAQAGRAALTGKTLVTIGKPTAAALTAQGCAPDVMAAESTVDGAIEALARDVLIRKTM